MKTTEKCLTEASLAEDCTLMAHTKNYLQAISDKFAEPCQFFGLQIRLSKMKVLYQTSSASEALRPHIKMDDTT